MEAAVRLHESAQLNQEKYDELMKKIQTDLDKNKKRGVTLRIFDSVRCAFYGARGVCFWDLAGSGPSLFEFLFIKPIAFIDLRSHVLGKLPGIGVVLAGERKVRPFVTLGNGALSHLGE